MLCSGKVMRLLYTIFKEVTNKLKYWNGSSLSFWFAIQAEKDLQKSAAKFTDTKSDGMKTYCILHVTIVSSFCSRHLNYEPVK